MKKLIIIVAVALLSGCANSVKIAEPTSVRPVVQQTAVEPTGGIFNTASYRPMFEDRRARFVGDTIVIAINEKTSASNKTSNNNSRTASTSFGISAFGTTPAATLAKGNLGANGSSKAEDKDEAKNDNTFSGTIVATVTEVLPNGNLLVSGEKQIGVNGDVDTLRFSGVVNPATIQYGNVVSSTQVADARIEAISRAAVDGARVAGFLARFFLNFIPFR
jgi:flagellar L-ring protein FlgH